MRALCIIPMNSPQIVSGDLRDVLLETATSQNDLLCVAKAPKN
jgi:hypothetical protein